jgi:hypothetical protein
MPTIATGGFGLPLNGNAVTEQREWPALKPGGQVSSFAKMPAASYDDRRRKVFRFAATQPSGPAFRVLGDYSAYGAWYDPQPATTGCGGSAPGTSCWHARRPPGGRPGRPGAGMEWHATTLERYVALELAAQPISPSEWAAPSSMDVRHFERSGRRDPHNHLIPEIPPGMLPAPPTAPVGGITDFTLRHDDIRYPGGGCAERGSLRGERGTR